MIERILTKRNLLIAAGLVLALVIFFWIWRRRPIQVPLPDDYATGNDQLTAAEQQQVRALSSALYDTLTGWALDIFFRRAKPYQDALMSSDRILTAVYNDFNEFYAKGNGTLTSWLKKDWYYSKSDAGQAVQLLLARLEKLNLP